MKLIIPTSGRYDKWERQTTLRYLPKSIKEQCIVVVQDNEYGEYRNLLTRSSDSDYIQILVLPPEITTLSPTRQWVIDQFPNDIVCLIDDDLRFYVRGKRPEVPLYLNYCEEEDLKEMFRKLEEQARIHGHSGISAREGNNFIEADHKWCARMMRCCAYNTKMVKDLNIDFNRLPCKTDFDVTLQFLRQGYPNFVSYHFAQGQVGGSNSKGGCSVYRDEKVLTEAAFHLAELHPEYVTVVEKETKSAWGGGIRTDVRIQWKKAYEDGKRSYA